MIPTCFIRDPKSPQINGICERFHKTVLNLAASKIVPQNLPPALAETLSQLPILSEGKSEAVICSGFSCQPPIVDPEQLRRMLGIALKS